MIEYVIFVLGDDGHNKQAYSHHLYPFIWLLGRKQGLCSREKRKREEN